MVEEKKEDDKQNKGSKWAAIRKQLKAAGKLKTKEDIDEHVFEINIPEFPENVIESETISCGFFSWTFKFMNKEIHGKKLATDMGKEMEQGNDDEQNQQNNNPIPPANQNQPRRQYLRHPINALAPKKKKLHRFDVQKMRAKANRRRQFGTRPGFMLLAECSPNMGEANRLTKDLVAWKLVSSIRVCWKEIEKKIDKNRLKFRTMVFTKRNSKQAINFYSPMKVKRPRTLLIRLRVFRIVNTMLNSMIKFDKMPGRVCLSAKGEHIFVHREALGIYSSVFRQQIQRGIGENEANPIKIDEKFTPSLVRLAFRALLSNRKISCSNVPELLDFGNTYKIWQLVAIIEESLISRRKCMHFRLKRKIELGYKFELFNLINCFVEKLDNIKAIEKMLEDTGLQDEFKERLKAKMKVMKEETEKIQMEKRAMRKQMREKKKMISEKRSQKRKEAKIRKDDEMKKKREAEETVQQDVVRKKMKKLKIEP